MCDSIIIRKRGKRKKMKTIAMQSKRGTKEITGNDEIINKLVKFATLVSEIHTWSHSKSFNFEKLVESKKMTNLRSRFEKLQDSIKETNQYSEWCEISNCRKDFNFGDLLS